MVWASPWADLVKWAGPRLGVGFIKLVLGLGQSYKWVGLDTSFIFKIF